MARISENSINSITTDWGKDESNGLPYSGQAVQDFIKSLFINLLNETETKYGYSEFTDGALIFYDKEGGTELSRIQFSGTNYVVDFGTAKNLTVLTSDESYYLPITPKSYSIELGSTNREEVVEDYIFKVEVDTGKGFIDLNVQDNTIKYGTTKQVDIRKMLVVGVNRVRVIVTGVESKQSKAIVYTTTLTSLTLECKHLWNNVWFEDKEYKITNIYFSGNVSKKLCVQIEDTIYETLFTANSEYKSVPYEFDVTGKLISNESKIVPIKVWIESDNVKTKTYEFNVMFVSSSDTKASLICINEVPNEVYNFELETLFSYATYNLTELTISIDANLNGEIIKDVFPPKTLSNLQPQIKYKESLFLQINTEALDNLFINYTIYNATGTIPLNNSHAYLAEPGAVFYMNPSLRSNNTDDKEQWYNSADNSKINATWNKFTFADDAWLQDDNSNRAFVVKAGSNVSVDYKPFIPTTGNSKTFEFMFKASNIADYDTPILTVINKEIFDINDTSCVGLVLYPTRLLIMTDNERQELFQLLLLSENRIIHLTVVIQRNYASNSATNLVRIFVNGCENVTFAIQNSSKLFIDSEFNNLRIGQQSSDFYLYMMRQYDKALSGQLIINNYLNALIETFEISRKGIKDDNAILDGGSISYDICKQVGYNTYVIETDKEIPSLDNSNTDNLRVNILLEYNDHPEWNVRINNTPIDGQGTTSSKYARWNLRNKVDKEATWIYPNLNNKTEKGKEGYIAGYGLNPKVSKITAKKNIASQPQGHKMGATSFYNDLFKKVLGDVYILENFPSPDIRVAVYQHPFMGFQKYSNGTYKFIGLYTIGPDKTDKKTFGYNATKEYPNLMMIEGPNHKPLLTRFLTPWTTDVFYSKEQETLSIGDPTGENQEGWDADIAGDFDTEKDNLLSLYEQEFKPAYDAIYFNSIYIASVEEGINGYLLYLEDNKIDSENVITDLLNPEFDVTTFLNSKTQVSISNEETRYFNNELMTFYDKAYNLIYYNVKLKKYTISPSYNVLDNLNLSETPTTLDIITARLNLWKEKVGNFVNLYEAYFHHCFCELIGASDNDAKNTYWRKFKALLINKDTGINEGGCWGFQQDDLDTIFLNDNNGQDTKKYFAEHNDVNENGGDVFQGRTSAFWATLRIVCKAEIQAMMNELINKAIELAGELNLSSSTLHMTIFNLIKYYFWDHSAKYFPATAYNEDTQWGYIDVWYKDPSKSYNSVPPLTQIHGDHFETEYDWVEKRIAYIFSKYLIGAYKDGNPDGYGSLDFTCDEAFVLNITPAIAQYPRISIGGQLTNAVSLRTLPGDVFKIALTPSKDTGTYIKGMDWISELGDLSGLKLNSRGGPVISFSVDSKRLQKLIIGNEEEPKFNSNSLTLNCPGLEILNAKNVDDLNTVVSLSLCPRIREIDLSGTKIPEVILPEGGRVEKLYLPKTINKLVVNNLKLLNDLLIESYENITTLYCYSNNPIEILNNILNTENNNLTHVGIVWNDTITVSDASLLIALSKLTELLEDGRYKYSSAYIGDQGTLQTDATSLSPPNIQGTLYIDNYVYERDIEKLQLHLNNLTVLYNADKLYVPFEDLEFEKIIADAYGDGIGTTQEQLNKVSEINLQSNKTVSYLNDLYKCSKLYSMQLSSSNIVEVNIPISASWDMRVSFRNMYKLEKLIISSEKITFINLWAITACKKLFDLVIPDSVVTIGTEAFTDTPLKRLVFGSGLISCGTDNATFRGHTNESVYIDSLKHWFEITFSQTPFTTQSKLYIGRIDAIRNPKKGNQIEYYDWDKLEGTGDYADKGEYEGKRQLVTTQIVNEVLQDTSITKFKNISNLKQLNGELIIPSHITTLGSIGSTKIEKITINSNLITAIPNGFAQNDTALKEFEIPNSVTSIGEYAFSGCTGLKSIEIPNSVTSIGEYAFSGCKGKAGSDLIIPKSVTSIGSYAFMSYASKGLKKLTIYPSNITLIGNNIFSNGANSIWEEVHIDDVQALYKNGYSYRFGGNAAFDLYVNGVLTTEIILNKPEQTATINTSLAFSNITTLIINEGVETILSLAFDGCAKLSFVDLPSSITSIELAFRSCNGARTGIFICRAVTPPYFNGVLFYFANIYVPDESVTAYQGAEGWSAYASKIKSLNEIEGFNLLPYSGIVGKVTTLKTTYDGIEVTPEYTIEGTVATIENGVLTFSEVGEVTVTATYNGESVSRTYSWSGAGSYVDITRQMTQGRNFPTPNVGEVHTYTAGTDSATSSIVLDVTNVANLCINGQGGTVSMLWCFTDENDIVISKATEKLLMQNEILDIPSNAKNVVINLTTAYGYSAKKVEVAYK